VLTVNDFPQLAISKIEIKDDKITVSFYHKLSHRPLFRLDFKYYIYESKTNEWHSNHSIIHTVATTITRDLEAKVLRSLRPIIDPMMKNKMNGGLPK
jgi:hypothetical protein